jgi:tRNA(Ile2) C34 agmatinyltransferase TiaS
MERVCPRCAASVDSHVFHCQKCGARVTAGLHVEGIRTAGKPVGEEAFDAELQKLLTDPDLLPPARHEPTAAERAVAAARPRGFWSRIFRRR